MQYPSKKYAKALVEVLLKAKDERKIKKISDNFLKLLLKNSDLRKAKEILLLAEVEWLKETKSKKITLETARHTKNLGALLRGVFKKDIIVEEKINKDLIAGIKIIINNEKQLDFSLKNTLEEVFNVS